MVLHLRPAAIIYAIVTLRGCLGGGVLSPV
jgi:hypothetical protein